MQEKDDSFIFHYKNVMLFLLLFGLSFLFLALTVSYIYIRVSNQIAPVQVPFLFYFNTLVLIASSWAMIRAKRSYLADQTAAYQQNLLITLWLSVLFAVMQGITWWWLFKQNIQLSSSPTAGLLYVISFTHLAHVLAGLPFLLRFYRAARKNMVDPVTVLVYFSDPEKRMGLRLLTIYWHFLDLLWIYLVLFFALNQLI